MLTKIFDFLFTGDWWTFNWKFDSGRWRCGVTRIRGDDKGLYFVPSVVLIFTPWSLILEQQNGNGDALMIQGVQSQPPPQGLSSSPPL